jgi:hypothetical protein
MSTLISTTSSVSGNGLVHITSNTTTEIDLNVASPITTTLFHSGFENCIFVEDEFIYTLSYQPTLTHSQFPNLTGFYPDYITDLPIDVLNYINADNYYKFIFLEINTGILSYNLSFGPELFALHIGYDYYWRYSNKYTCILTKNNAGVVSQHLAFNSADADSAYIMDKLNGAKIRILRTNMSANQSTLNISIPQTAQSFYDITLNNSTMVINGIDIKQYNPITYYSSYYVNPTVSIPKRVCSISNSTGGYGQVGPSFSFRGKAAKQDSIIYSGFNVTNNLMYFNTNYGNMYFAKYPDKSSYTNTYILSTSSTSCTISGSKYIIGFLICNYGTAYFGQGTHFMFPSYYNGSISLMQGYLTNPGSVSYSYNLVGDGSGNFTLTSSGISLNYIKLMLVAY